MYANVDAALLMCQCGNFSRFFTIRSLCKPILVGLLGYPIYTCTESYGSVVTTGNCRFPVGTTVPEPINCVYRAYICGRLTRFVTATM